MRLTPHLSQRSLPLPSEKTKCTCARALGPPDSRRARVQRHLEKKQSGARRAMDCRQSSVTLKKRRVDF
ncbi:hypothetical protein MHYP_G00114390 [Metynnis hypsauchen]